MWPRLCIFNPGIQATYPFINVYTEHYDAPGVILGAGDAAVSKALKILLAGSYHSKVGRRVVTK